jgi:hypothetical protein
VEPSGGRARGPLGIAQSWVQVLRHPVAFFEEAVSPGDQGPGLLFAMLVVLVEEGTRLALVPAARPVVGGSDLVGGVLFVAVVTLLVTPLGLHAIAAVETLVLLVAPTRAGISETVQVLAYAGAPCALAGLPYPALRTVTGVWAMGLLIVGFHVVHDLRYPVAVVLATPAAVLGIGYGFRWFGAAVDLLPGLAGAIPW